MQKIKNSIWVGSSIVASLSLISFSLVTNAYGAGLNVGANVNVQVGVGGDRDKASTSVEVETDEEGSGMVQLGSGKSVNANSRRGNDNGIRVSAENKNSVDIENENDQDDNEIKVDQRSAKDSTTTIDVAERVSNRGQLRSFLNHIVKGDDRIADVNVSSTTVETHYKLPARFLWAIPANITANVTINANGSVAVTYPWYAFLFATNKGVEDHLNASSSTIVSGQTTFSASTQAHLLNSLFTVLKESKN